MKEKPILFSDPMVRAILGGRKTQTRRIVKPRPRIVHGICNDYSIETNLLFRGKEQRIKCHYGQPGDRLWVRETWCGKADPGTSRLMWNEDGETYQCHYRADGEDVFLDDGDGAVATGKNGQTLSPWKTPIFMPRWASRITLEITDVRVERLNEISEADAKAEGVEWLPGDGCSWGYAVQPNWKFVHDTAQEAYRELWESINGPGSWAANPWVWVIEFKRLEGGAS